MNGTAWYLEWLGFHREATAAAPDAIAALLAAEEIAVESWQATKEELEECTRRLVRSRRTPKFANEHSDAIGTELVTLRAERDRAGFMAALPTGPSDCPERCFRGLLTAPLPHLVLEGKPGRALARQTCVVLCDVCAAGKAEIAAQDRLEQCAAPEERWKKKKLKTLSQYLERTKGMDGIGLLREHEAHVRLVVQGQREDLKSLPTIKATLAAAVRVPFKERARGPEAIPA